MTASGLASPAPDPRCVGALLGSLLAVLPASLVGARQRVHLRVAVAPFAAAQGEAVVEVHLGGVLAADLTARVWRAGAREILAAPGSVPQSTLRFLAEWVRSEGALARVPYVELEQDIVNGEPLQWVGPATRPDFRHGGDITSTHAQDYETGMAVLRALPDWPPPAAVLGRFRRLLERLPAGTRLNMMSSLGARAHSPRSGLRMILSGPGRVAVQLAGLNDLNQARAERLLSQYAQPIIGFDLEFVDDGSEYFAFYRRFSHPDWTDSDLRVFLDHALGDGLLTQHELHGFRALASAERRGHLVLTFKLVLRDNRPVRLKAYVERLVY